MNETLGQLFETLSNLEPTITGGVAIAAISVGYFVYNIKKNKKSTDEEYDVNEKEASKDINDITIETKYFNVDDSQETTDVTTFKDLDNFSPKSNTDLDKDKDIQENLELEPITSNEVSVLDNYDNTIDFIEESNKDIDKISFNHSSLEEKKPTHFQIDDDDLNQLSTITLEIPSLSQSLETTDASQEKKSIPELEINQEIIIEPKQEQHNQEQPKILLFNSFSNPNEIENKESNELLVFALEADNHKNRKDALTYLQQAIQTETNLANRVRLKIIFQTYENTDKNLSKILEEIPSLKQIEELSKKKSEPIRFVKAEDLKFTDDDEDEYFAEKTEDKDDFNVSSLLAIPQDEPEVENTSENHSLSGEEINNKVINAMNNFPSISDVTFKNVDAHNLEEKDGLETFLESLAIDIEKYNLQQDNQSVEDNLLTEKILEEIKSKEIEQHSTNAPVILDAPSIHNEPEKSSQQDLTPNNEINNKLASLSELNFKEVSNVKIEEQVKTKVWVNLIVYNGEQIFVNKKFQINGEFGSLDGNTSLNRQVNSWVKQTYNTTSYVVTLLLPVQ